MRDRSIEQECTEQTDYSNLISHSAHWLLATLDVIAQVVVSLELKTIRKYRRQFELYNIWMTLLVLRWHFEGDISCNLPWFTVKIENVWRLLAFHLWNRIYRYQCGTRILFPEHEHQDNAYNRESRYAMIHLIEAITPMHNCTHALFFFSLGRFRDNEIDDNTLDLEEKWCRAVGAKCRYMWRTHAR